MHSGATNLINNVDGVQCPVNRMEITNISYNGRTKTIDQYLMRGNEHYWTGIIQCIIEFCMVKKEKNYHNTDINDKRNHFCIFLGNINNSIALLDSSDCRNKVELLKK